MNDEALFSEHWFRVRHLKPRLAVDVTVRRQRFRGVTAWVLHRSSTRTFNRLGNEAWRILSRADGSRTVDELWQLALEQGGDDAPSQATMIEWLAQLHEAELLSVNHRLNAEQLFDRGSEKAGREKRQRYLNPLYARFALFDPDALLNRLQPLANRLFGRAPALILTLLCVLALFLIAPHNTTLIDELSELSLFAPDQALSFLLIYPALKLLHELAHALAIKRLGGEVHEMGIALMVLLPVPYVDASAASLFTDKRDRILVSAAGVLLELSMAALAAIVWVNSSGLLHDLALAVMVVGSASTVLFNGNPLLKFDGYYVLADAIEIPNLATRARDHLLERCRIRLLGMPPRVAPLPDRNEGRWLLAYGLLSTTYRLGLMFSIAWMLSGDYFFFGVALALWIVATSLLQPAWRFVQFLRRYGRQVRSSTVLVSSSLAVAIMIALLWLPLPRHTLSEGVVWLPEDAIVRMASRCGVEQVDVASGSFVEPGTALFDCVDQDSATHRSVLQARIAEAQARAAGLAIREPVTFRLIQEELSTLQAELAEATRQQQAQHVVAETAGRFTPADTLSLAGRYFDQGEVAAFVVPAHRRTLRVAIDQTDIGLVQKDVRGVELVFAEASAGDGVHSTTIRRRSPSATYDVPSPALTTVGGGLLATDDDGRSVRQAVFDFELDWPASAPPASVGSRVAVRFEHAPAPLFARLITQVRRVMSSRISA